MNDKKLKNVQNNRDYYKTYVQYIKRIITKIELRIVQILDFLSGLNISSRHLTLLMLMDVLSFLLRKCALLIL